MSSIYKDKSLPELLDMLHGLAMPEPVSWLPETVGWSILFVWVLVLASLIVLHAARRRHRNRYRREALAALAQIERRAQEDPVSTAQDISVLLKRTALAVYPRQQVAPLYGSAWAQFLQDSSNGDRKIAAVAAEFASAAYHPAADGRNLLDPARRWIRLHRA